jgi:ABC-type uncharacterized transport system ATPase subunit
MATMIRSLQHTGGPGVGGPGAVVASLERVNKNYGNVPALKAVNFRVRAGEVVAMLGPNGAGKTTAVKLLLGLLEPNAGRVRVLGGDPTNPENRMRTGATASSGTSRGGSGSAFYLRWQSPGIPISFFSTSPQ